MAPWLNQRFHELFDDNPNVGEVRSIGLINAIELVEDKETKKAFDSSLRLGYRIYRKALEKGLMLRPLGDVMYFNPPLVISKEELEEALDICKWKFLMKSIKDFFTFFYFFSISLFFLLILVYYL